MTLLQTRLKIFCQLWYIGHVIVRIHLVPIRIVFELHFICLKQLQKSVLFKWNFLIKSYKKPHVLFFFEIIIREHSIRPQHNKISHAVLVLIDSPYRPTSRIAQRSTWENWKSWFLNIQSSSIGINKHNIALRFVNIEHLFFTWPRNIWYQLLCLLPSVIIFRPSICDPSNFWL